MLSLYGQGFCNARGHRNKLEQSSREQSMIRERSRSTQQINTVHKMQSRERTRSALFAGSVRWVTESMHCRWRWANTSVGSLRVCRVSRYGYSTICAWDMNATNGASISQKALTQLSPPAFVVYCLLLPTRSSCPQRIRLSHWYAVPQTQADSFSRSSRAPPQRSTTCTRPGPRPTPPGPTACLTPGSWPSPPAAPLAPCPLALCL